MKKLFAFFASVIITAASSFTAFALPGIKAYVPDAAGEYVYYSDSTFKTKSVFGICRYDEETYALRFYNGTKDITAAVKLDAEKTNVEFTGESVFGVSNNEEDVEIVNYLHDMLYELCARRQKISFSEDQLTVKTEDSYEQFGGNVVMEYNALIPLFGLEKISSTNGDVLLQLQCIGLLSGQEDKSFSSYKRIDTLPKDNKRSFKLNKKAAGCELAYSPNGSLVKLNGDENWKQLMENCWTLGDSAFISLDVINLPSEYAPKTSYLAFAMEKGFLRGTEDEYSLWMYSTVENKDGITKMNMLKWQPSNGNVKRDIRYVVASENGKIYLANLTVFENVYSKNKKYFNAILESLCTK